MSILTKLKIILENWRRRFRQRWANRFILQPWASSKSAPTCALWSSLKFGQPRKTSSEGFNRPRDLQPLARSRTFEPGFRGDKIIPLRRRFDLERPELSGPLSVVSAQYNRRDKTSNSCRASRSAKQPPTPWTRADKRARPSGATSSRSTSCSFLSPGWRESLVSCQCLPSMEWTAVDPRSSSAMATTCKTPLASLQGHWSCWKLVQSLRPIGLVNALQNLSGSDVSAFEARYYGGKLLEKEQTPHGVEKFEDRPTRRYRGYSSRCHELSLAGYYYWTYWQSLWRRVVLFVSPGALQVI